MSLHKSSLLVLIFSFFSNLLFSQNIDKNHITFQNAKSSLSEFKELLAIPNDAHYPEDIDKNADWCIRKLEALSFSAQKLQTATVPLVVASYNKVSKSKPTMLYYFHIDGQPTDASFWFQEDPYKAVLKEESEEGWKEIGWKNLLKDDPNPEWRIFARSSSDDKSPFVMFMAALRTMHENDKEIPYNLKIVLDFEEEIGSPNLAAAVKKYIKELSADYLLIFDGPKHPNSEPTIAFGARGITTMTLQVFGPTLPLHSGHYGNYAPNPALNLSKLLASMKDDNGRVLIPGYYDGITLDKKTRQILSDVPDDEKALKFKLGIGDIDSVGTSYQESIQYPSLNIRGMSSAWTGDEVRTIVPATAIAELDLRLVVESDGLRLQELVRKHISDQGFYITSERPTKHEKFIHKKICQVSDRKNVTKAFRTEFDSTIGNWAYESLKKSFGKDPIRLRTMGGTLPTSPFIVTLDVPALVIPLVNSDNNQHSPNENLRLGNYYDGVKCIYGLLNSTIRKL